MTTLDPRIERGTRQMLELRARALADGATPLGWKAGFGAPAAMEALALDRPLVGFLTRERLLEDGAHVDLAGSTGPVLEAEVAAVMGTDLGGGASPEDALAAVAGWSVAIELADLDRPPNDVEAVLAGNIFHRHVLLGPVVDDRPEPETLVVRVLRDDAEVAATDATEALTGALGTVLATMADTLATCGAGLRGGDVVITGSVVPPVRLEPGRWTVEAPGLGALSVGVG
jgi:2-keto-4-pentenoate hydratase